MVIAKTSFGSITTTFKSHRNNMNKKKIILLSAGGVLLTSLIFGGYWYVNYNSWSSVKDSDSVKELERFVRDNESNLFVEDAKERIEQIKFTEDTLFQTVRRKRSVYHCERYINAYKSKENRYMKQVMSKYDSLTYEFALQQGTFEAYEKYLTVFPSGAFYYDALNKSKTTLSSVERTRVLPVVNNFLVAYKNRDAGAVVSFLADNVKRFENFTDIPRTQIYVSLIEKLENINYSRWDLPMEGAYSFEKLESGNILVRFKTDKDYFIKDTFNDYDNWIHYFATFEVFIEVETTNFLVVSYFENSISSSVINDDY
jgi:hypothetical protein